MKFITKALFALFILAAANISAQEIPAINQDAKLMSIGSKNAFVISYEGVGTKEVTAQWQKALKKYKTKVKKNKAKELFADDATMPDISTNTVDVYATISEDGANKATILTVWYDLGGAFLNAQDHPVQAEAAQNMLNDFSLQIGAISAEDKLEMEEDNLKNLQKELKKLEKEKEDGLSEIEKAKKLIADTEKMIEENAATQATKKDEIKSQEIAVEKARSERAKYPKL